LTNYFAGENMKKVWVYILCIILFVTACQSSATPSIPAASDTPDAAAATETSEPVAEVTATSAYLQFRANLCCSGTSVIPGEYQFPEWLHLPFTITVKQEGWKHFNEEPGELFAIIKGNSNSLGIFSEVIDIFPAYDPTKANQFFSAFVNAAEFEVVAEPSETTIAGYPAQQVDLIAKPSTVAENAEEDLPFGVQPLKPALQFSPTGLFWTTQSPEAHLRVLKVDIDDVSVIIYLESPQADFDRFVSEALAILETLAPLP
jgi:hypothetical protein